MMVDVNSWSLDEEAGDEVEIKNKEMVPICGRGPATHAGLSVDFPVNEIQYKVNKPVRLAYIGVVDRKLWAAAIAWGHTETADTLVLIWGKSTLFPRQQY